MTLTQFISDPQSARAWVEERPRNLEVYVRKGIRSIQGHVTNTLTIADIQMADLVSEVPQAAFAVWFDTAEIIAQKHGMSIAFENVGGWPWMSEFLALRHFTRSNDPNIYADQIDAFRIHRTSL